MLESTFLETGLRAAGKKWEGGREVLENQCQGRTLQMARMSVGEQEGNKRRRIINIIISDEQSSAKVETDGISLC